LGSEGGFGIVFVGERQGYGPLAVKRLKLEVSEAAHRELDIAKELSKRKLAHVMAVLDAGQDAESEAYFVVMPRAQKSLQDELGSGKVWEAAQAAVILLEIAQGLSEIPDIVHRDLKPANVLYHEGKWKIADFGIARFVEEATSTRTLRECLSPPYAAPEQWRLERAGAATDIYALGCIGYALLTGHPPFPGPRTEDFQDQHLNREPPRMEKQDPKLRSFLHMMLRKSPQARPRLDRVTDFLGRAVQATHELQPEAGLAALATAGALLSEREAKEEARSQLEKEKREARARLASDAFEILREIIERMCQKILDSVPAAKLLDRVRSGMMKDKACIGLGTALLEVTLMSPGFALPGGAFSQSGWDVVAGATVGARQSDPKYLWDASLWFTNLGHGDNYRWYEVSYFVNPLSGRVNPGNEPFALLETHLREADEAASPVMGLFQIAFGPEPIDGEHSVHFTDRWAGLLAKAAKGELGRPRSLPLRP
jgi:serine/threonine-protein kinase